jgi:hypothetical protein
MLRIAVADWAARWPRQRESGAGRDGTRGGGGALGLGDVGLRRAPDRGGGMGPCGGAGCGRHPLSTWEGSRCRRRRRPRQPSPPPPLIERRLPSPPPVRRGRRPCQALTAARRACTVRSAAGGPLPPSRGAARQVGAGRSLTRRGPPCGYSHESGPGGARTRRRQRVAERRR